MAAVVPQGDGNGTAIDVKHADGSQPLHLAVPDPGNSLGAPSWAPGGTSLVFIERGTTGADVWVIGADTSGLAKLVHLDSAETDLAWCPVPAAAQ